MERIEYMEKLFGAIRRDGCKLSRTYIAIGLFSWLLAIAWSASSRCFLTENKNGLPQGSCSANNLLLCERNTLPAPSRASISIVCTQVDRKGRKANLAEYDANGGGGHVTLLAPRWLKPVMHEWNPIWKIIGDTAQSGQAFSVDGDKTWEVNWINHDARIRDE